MPDFEIEKSLNVSGPVFGFDEAGRGPWCGPVVAACVSWPNFEIPADLSTQIDDSKKLTAAKRKELYEKITHSSALYGIGTASAAEIDQYNILQATFLAMRRALENALQKKAVQPAFLLIDGNRLPLNCPYPAKAVIKGDSRSLSVAAASVLAKVTRDQILTELAQQYPHYGWEKNAGYGTKEHIAAIEKYGITPVHRKTYAPVRRYLETHQ